MVIAKRDREAKREMIEARRYKLETRREDRNEKGD